MANIVGMQSLVLKVSFKCLVIFSICFGLELNPGDVDGFYLDISSSGSSHKSKTIYSSIESFEAALRPSELECPSDNVIITKYRCQVDNEWTDCSRSNCCPSYTYVAGRCVPDDINPCSLNLCEQKCSVYFGRVVCTCFSGYKFNRQKHLLASSQQQQQEDENEQQQNAQNHQGQNQQQQHLSGTVQACEDIDECQDNNGDCEQICINEEGFHRCDCKPGFHLGLDNHTCISDQQGAIRNQEDVVSSSHHGSNMLGSCNMGCSSIISMKQQVSELNEIVRSLNTAIKLYSFAAGPPGAPGPAGPPGPPGTTGPRGFPGTGSLTSSGGVGLADFGDAYQHPQSINNNDDDEDEIPDSENDSLDSFKMVRRNGKKHFCKCKRGPVGPPGSPGMEGPRGIKGESGLRGIKGEAGSLDFFMLMIADLRHDLEQLQARVFPKSVRDNNNRALPRYNMQQHMAWEKKMREKHAHSALTRNNQPPLLYNDNLVVSASNE